MLELVELSKRYGEVVALDGLDLTVREGEMVGFVGTNGAGKTTAMRICMGVLSSDSGQVRWRGAPADAAAWRSFGYMPEERGLYPKMRVGDQLAYLASLRGVDPTVARRDAVRWLEALGLHARVDDRVEALSLGNQQRVQLAVALVHGPELLVLDEPFSGLDPVGVDALAEVLRERVAAGVGVLFSSHQLELVERLCDRVAIIRAGRLVAQGTVEELSADPYGRVVRVRVTAPPGWPERLAREVLGAELVRVEQGTSGQLAVLRLAPDADDDVLVDSARRLGTLHELTPDRGSLVERFRSVVAEPAVAA